MQKLSTHTGFIIALAWPQMYCKQVGVWYDRFTGPMGVKKHGYYKVGHAALVLVDSEAKSCHYFDFGRYHAPYQHGRVRSELTDHELRILTKPVISADGRRIENYQEILEELQQNPACHGDGNLHAGYIAINYQAARSKALELMHRHIIPYGPFQPSATNCSRFVNTVIRAGKPDWWRILRLKYYKPVTPTTLNNVHALREVTVVPRLLPGDLFVPQQRLEPARLYGTLPAPEIPKGLSPSVQWLAGEGSGSWFDIVATENGLWLKRYDANGQLEGGGFFVHKTGENLPADAAYQVTYPSNCMILTLQMGQKKLQFHWESAL